MAVADAGGPVSLPSPGVTFFLSPGKGKTSDGVARPFPFAGVGVGGFAEVPFPFEVLLEAVLGAVEHVTLRFVQTSQTSHKQQSNGGAARECVQHDTVADLHRDST